MAQKNRSVENGYAAITRLHVPRIPTGEAPERLTAGVPLARLIKRKLIGDSAILLTRASSPTAESFRRLRTSLVEHPDGEPQVLVVASPKRGEGRSFVALNLALAFATDKQRSVLLVDADLRRPSIGQSLRPAPALGLSEVLENRTELDHAVLDLVNSSLMVLPAGAPPREPAELLTTERTKTTFDSLRHRFDTIIVDSPPILPFVDADIIGALADGFLLLARAGETEKSTYLQAICRVTSRPILGRVLNETPR